MDTFRDHETQEEYESRLKADREQHKNAWAAKTEDERKSRSAAIAGAAKMKRQCEDEVTADDRRKANAAKYRGMDRKKR